MAELVKERLIKKFEDEIHALDRELKVELPREILRARELGDLRENAEYHAAKERQRLVESRISMLQKRVSEIALLNIDRIPTDRAGFVQRAKDAGVIGPRSTSTGEDERGAKFRGVRFSGRERRRVGPPRHGLVVAS